MNQDISLTARPVANPRVVVQQFDDELVVYDEEQALSLHLNTAAAIVWLHCDSATTVEALVDAVFALYPETPRARVEEDVRVALRELMSHGLIICDVS
ncbi:MAG: PqqD family protein [Candidatus Eisenbacteria bacterium]|nr:PqqD family protein [Candidatus Eisenbacteria bacterium]